MTDAHPPVTNSIPAFFTPAERAVLPDRARSFTGLTYAVIEGYRHLHLDVHLPATPEGPVPLVVWMHGGAWLFGVRDLLPPEWPPNLIIQSALDAGLAIATIDYRHSREAAFPAQLHDAKAAIRYLRAFATELGIDPDRIAVWGESAGGHLAALVALVDDPILEGSVGVAEGSSRVSAAVCFYPVTDVESLPPMISALPEHVRQMLTTSGVPLPPEPVDVLIEHSPYSPEEARRILSPVSHVGAGAPPFLLIHGDADRLVPVGQSIRLNDLLAAAGADVTLVTVPGADHVFAGTDPRPQAETAVTFLAARLQLD
ncbi:alpha/beta hydrolase [Subtercola frigoramans]|uniref:Acetyl esterase/lipase n=1 Tax=Subtercola frigoramans TaxID=120298 RepID=A0ABS2L2A3_9MICO|nr:alpha/beta hydrolase [Subtercola frigoramans]MBM7471206.1 acetyl esterase/lipase [Subtercola frigoramans]